MRMKHGDPKIDSMEAKRRKDGQQGRLSKRRGTEVTLGDERGWTGTKPDDERDWTERKQGDCRG